MNEVEAPEPFLDSSEQHGPYGLRSKNVEISRCTSTHLKRLKSYSQCERNMIELSLQV